MDEAARQMAAALRAMEPWRSQLAGASHQLVIAQQFIESVYFQSEGYFFATGRGRSASGLDGTSTDAFVLEGSRRLALQQSPPAPSEFLACGDKPVARAASTKKCRGPGGERCDRRTDPSVGGAGRESRRAHDQTVNKVTSPRVRQVRAAQLLASMASALGAIGGTLQSEEPRTGDRHFSSENSLRPVRSWDPLRADVGGCAGRPKERALSFSLLAWVPSDCLRGLSMRTTRLVVLTSVAAFLFAACSGQVGSSANLSLAPSPVSLEPGEALAFAATGEASTVHPSGDLTWSVEESGGGTVDASGNYTAPLAPKERSMSWPRARPTLGRRPPSPSGSGGEASASGSLLRPRR